MIARYWRGWTKPHNADTYESFLQTNVLPHLKKIEGCHGGYLMRKDDGEDVEFLIIHFFDSIEAVKRFAGPNYTTPVFEPEVQALLSRFDTIAAHYEVKGKTV